MDLIMSPQKSLDPIMKFSIMLSSLLKHAFIRNVIFFSLPIIKYEESQLESLESNLDLEFISICLPILRGLCETHNVVS